MSAENKPTFSIAVTGEAGLSGNSTLSKLLADHYNFNYLSAGTIRRQLAQVWNSYQQSSLTWTNFVDDLIADRLIFPDNEFTSPTTEEALANFNQLMHSSPLDVVEKIDRYTDTTTLAAIEQGSVVVDGKVAILIGVKIFPEHTPNHPIIRLLVLAPDLNTRVSRLIKREKINDVSITHRSNLKNKLNLRFNTDWKRYFEIYGIVPEDLIKVYNVIEIDGSQDIHTSFIQAIQAIDSMLNYYSVNSSRSFS